MTEPPDKLAALTDTARVLDAIGVPYALVGGVAVGIRSGVPRATLDTDLAATSTAARPMLIRAFVEAGFQLVGEFDHTIKLRHARGEPVQLVLDAAFDPMIARAQPVAVGALSVPVVQTADLIVMKEQAANDPARRRSKALRNQADVALLRGDVPDPDEGW